MVEQWLMQTPAEPGHTIAECGPITGMSLGRSNRCPRSPGHLDAKLKVEVYRLGMSLLAPPPVSRAKSSFDPCHALYDWATSCAVDLVPPSTMAHSLDDVVAVNHLVELHGRSALWIQRDVVMTLVVPDVASGTAAKTAYEL